MHLWWDIRDQIAPTCLYGQVTVLMSHTAVYYCGANWHPGEPAGGYCGIQHNSESERRTIFSVWDTNDKLYPKVTAADQRTYFDRFGGEGTGAHTHMPWQWQLNETFEFFVSKHSSGEQLTDVRYYVMDRAAGRWIHVSTITSPNGGHGCVATIGGALNSFLENFAGREHSIAKIALFRLWLGPSIERLTFLTSATGNTPHGSWGELSGSFFLAEGGMAELQSAFSILEPTYGRPSFGYPGMQLGPALIPDNICASLSALPIAALVK